MEAGVTAGHSQARGYRRGLLLIFAVVFLLRIPFLNQAIQGDDHIYLTEAQHALIDPLHPSDVKYVFLGNEVDLRGHSHPPLDAWILAGLITVCGDIYEVPFHAAYILFSLIAAWAMWSLARRFSPHPIWAALLFLAVPAFVINGNSLESDLPLLAFWMASIALFTCDAEGARDRWALAMAALSMALAAMAAYQAIFLTPILAVYVWLYHRHSPARWWLTLTPAATIAAWQIFVRASTGALPAGMLAGYFASYGFQAFTAKCANALALAIHSCFLVFPALLPAAVLLAWRKRRERDTLFLLAWITIFFAGALVVFFAGSARYLLPMAAPVALLASRLRVRWLAAGFVLQMALSLGLAVVNYQHWDGYRQFAASLHDASRGHRVWVDGEWGLRYYLESDGALPLRKTQRLRAGDIVVLSELAYPVAFTAPVTAIRRMEIRPSLPLRLIGLESHSGYSTVSRGFWPFGISSGPIDRLSAVMIAERHPALVYLPMNDRAAADQLVSGVYSLEAGRFRWMSKSGVIVLKNPAAPMRLHVDFTIPPQAPARQVRLLLDGREVASQTYTAPGTYSLASAEPVRGSGSSATVEIDVDQTFSPPGDSRELGIVLTGVGFVP
ncbi:MAG TPA: glycosyltransferase family 39 protein [Bryobacteraceae bacterium]|nr:glycosyltransferase family 39 protein [Bryobacteraceae bacterium]